MSTWQQLLIANIFQAFANFEGSEDPSEFALLVRTAVSNSRVNWHNKMQVNGEDHTRLEEDWPVRIPYTDISQLSQMSAGDQDGQVVYMVYGTFANSYVLSFFELFLQLDSILGEEFPRDHFGVVCRVPSKKPNTALKPRNVFRF